MKNGLLLVGLVAAALGPAVVRAQGYQVQPMLATLTPSGPKARLTMAVKNTGAVPITIEFVPFRATVDEAGTPTRVDETKDVLVYPSQTIIPPGREQSVQVRYIGDAALADARMYGVRVVQVPIDFATGAVGKVGGTTTVKVSFNFLSHIIVSPPTAVPVLSIEAREGGIGGDLALMLVNAGPGIAILNEAKLELTDARGTVTLIPAARFEAGDFSALMPHQNRRVTVIAKETAALIKPIKFRLIVN